LQASENYFQVESKDQLSQALRLVFFRITAQLLQHLASVLFGFLTAVIAVEDSFVRSDLPVNALVGDVSKRTSELDRRF